jgi:two-component system nitrate/nitrite response regulator NarL
MRCTSVVIADRHPVVLQGLTNVLRAESGFKVVACCSDGTDCDLSPANSSKNR